MAWSVPDILGQTIPAPTATGPPKTKGRRTRLGGTGAKYADEMASGPSILRVNGTARLCVRAAVFQSALSGPCSADVQNDRRRHLRAKGSPHLNLRAKISGVVILTVVAAGLIPAAIAQGSPLQDKQAQAQRLEAQIQANGSRIVTLSEKLNGARIRLEKAQAGIADSERRTAEAQAQTDRIDHLLHARAAGLQLPGNGNRSRRST